MGRELSGLSIAVLGGDRRELELIEELSAQGAKVKAAGFPPIAELSGAMLVDTAEEAISGADVVIIGMCGVDADCKIKTLDPSKKLILTERALAGLPRGTPFFIGSARREVRELATKLGLRLIEVAEVDEVAILNSIPTAEGAVQVAMEELPITVHGCTALVLGLGRVGLTLVRVLMGLRARTIAAARSPAQLARAEEMGAFPARLEVLPEIAKEIDVVFNTIPAMVITEEVLMNMKKEALIVDLASSPGGTDFEAAGRLGIKAILASGLPGKVAPKTAGRILAKTVPNMIKEALADLH